MDEKLYIPMGVKPEAEFFRGFGRKQITEAVIGSLACVLIACILWFVTHSVTVTMIAFLSGIAGSIMMTGKDQSNLSVVDQIRNMVRFAKSQKVYPYRYSNEWTVM
ncbi:MAG TPA: hypothetical protein DEP23_15825 [Ruminococcaceae bacterium]|nr:hypothetical protein [Oscillospiraceae bacterium]